MRIVTILLLLLPGLLPAQKTPFYTKVEKGRLPELLKAGSPILPMVSAHRGGRFYPDFPENSIAVFEQTLSQAPAILECDISLTRDSALVILHDNTLDRTSTCSGRVDQQTLRGLKVCRLEDDFGKVTREKIPTLQKTLRWAKGKAILSLDVKRGVPFEQVVALVEKHRMEDYVMIITYNVADAQKVHRLNPELMLSVSIRNAEEMARFAESGIPFSRMVAFTGTTESDEAFYAALHEKGIATILGTLGNLDKRAEARGPQTYREFIAKGVDILATDRPVEAWKAIREAAQRRPD